VGHLDLRVAKADLADVLCHEVSAQSAGTGLGGAAVFRYS
jgi:hypothetical protein